ncbi:MAG: hypothetical protein JNM31_06535 [Flavobacteriales bacterium]|nr:hypothetical protein [Flavobacteriales bacterium]
MLLNSCGKGIFAGRITEGVIEYALSFPDIEPDGIMSGMLPERTYLYFDKDRQVAELSAGMGLFKTTVIADNDERKLDYHLAIMGKRLVAHMGEGDVRHMAPQDNRMTLVWTNEFDTISGMHCRKAVAIYDDIALPEVELYYTDQIQMGSPNWFGPYSEIPGVLLRYEMVQNGIRMRLNAVAVKPGPVERSRFSPLPDHTPVGVEQLSAELASVLSAFSQ